jgi:hypothetical protein
MNWAAVAAQIVPKANIVSMAMQLHNNVMIVPLAFIKMNSPVHSV